ncbi:MAG TPA: hypothetical protein VLH19_00715, partial [Patescibacteria group bacterium]|nr:hypothetical protein [Patescibacteria group bacterium]
KQTLRQLASLDLITWKRERVHQDSRHPYFVFPGYTFQGRQVAISGFGNLSLRFSTDGTTWIDREIIMHPREDKFDKGPLSPEFVMTTEKGILLLYRSMQDGHQGVGVALLDISDPRRILWRSESPVWTPPKEWDHENERLIGVCHLDGRLLSYWQILGKGVYLATYGLFKISDGHSSKDVSLQLARSKNNPMIAPNPKNSWESFTTFNPAAVYDGGKVHLLYRAQGYDYISVLGYATSSDGEHIDERFEEPIYLPTANFEYTGTNKPKQISHMYMSGGGYGGCEDPRMTRVDDKYYLTYVAFDGVQPPRVALTSITVENFLNRRWLWERPVLISPPGVVDKSAVIFPEKINGKYVVMHRIYPDILIDFVDSLEFDGSHWLEGKYKISPRPNMWDSRKIGAGAPPLKTAFGWLLIYQSVGEQDSGRYKVGAMLLDLKDPTKVIARSQSPILEPDASYENEGFKSGVIYPCGAVIIGEKLYVYYGGADSYVCSATANLNEFLVELLHSEVARLTKPMVESILML